MKIQTYSLLGVALLGLLSNSCKQKSQMSLPQSKPQNGGAGASLPCFFEVSAVFQTSEAPSSSVDRPVAFLVNREVDDSIFDDSSLVNFHGLLEPWQEREPGSTRGVKNISTDNGASAYFYVFKVPGDPLIETNKLLSCKDADTTGDTITNDADGSTSTGSQTCSFSMPASSLIFKQAVACSYGTGQALKIVLGNADGSIKVERVEATPLP